MDPLQPHRKINAAACQALECRISRSQGPNEERYRRSKRNERKDQAKITKNHSGNPGWFFLRIGAFINTIFIEVGRHAGIGSYILGTADVTAAAFANLPPRQRTSPS